MSLYDYKISRKLISDDLPFYALIMAAFRQADTYNADALYRAFPALCEELIARYNAPGGILPSDPEGRSA